MKNIPLWFLLLALLAGCSCPAYDCAGPYSYTIRTNRYTVDELATMQALLVAVPSGQVVDSIQTSTYEPWSNGGTENYLPFDTFRHINKIQKPAGTTSFEWHLVLARDTFRVGDFRIKSPRNNWFTGCSDGCDSPESHTVNGEVQQGSYIDI